MVRVIKAEKVWIPVNQLLILYVHVHIQVVRTLAQQKAKVGVLPVTRTEGEVLLFRCLAPIFGIAIQSNRVF